MDDVIKCAHRNTHPIKEIYYKSTHNLTCHVNNLNRYRFVTMAKTTIKIIKSDEAGFKIRTKNRPARGK